MRHTRNPLLRAAVTALAVVLLSAGGVVGSAQASTPRAAAVIAQPVLSADLSTFRPGHIITDAVFFNASAMTEQQIQAFLESRVPSCQSGYTCLRDWRDNSRSVAADAMCGPYSGVANERASTIIFKVAQACGINPQVILATLQKEQGLVTHTWPSTWRYTIAMGQGCPDTAACDTRYHGFFNQVYGAAWQFKRYANPAGTSRYFTWYAPGNTWNVRFHPNQSCGSSAVYIENQATANLYYYTPYQPNAASLRAGYGEGDGCSSYGNRNFFNYFTDWFGSSTIAVQGSIAAAWNANGGSAGWLGGPVASMIYTGANGSGWYQRFQNGTIYVVNGGATTILKASSLIHSTYTRSGGPTDGIGWPVSGEVCGRYGCSIQFQSGSLVWSNETLAVGRVVGAINATWLAGGGVDNPLAAPEEAETYVSAGGGGWTQSFLRGKVFVKAAGPTTTFSASSSLLARYESLSGPSGALGWPVASEACGTIGCVIDFEGGALTWDSAGGAIESISGEMKRVWFAEGGVNNWVGAASGAMGTRAGGWTQEFRNATYYLKAGQVVTALKRVSAIHDRYRALGGAASTLGWPLAAESCGTQGCAVQLEAGSISWEGRSGILSNVSGAINSAWWRSGGTSSAWGAPVSEQADVSGVGATQAFRNGVAYAKSGGATVFHRSSSALAASYRSMGGPQGTLGWPVAEETCGNGQCTLSFEAGALVWSSATGEITRR
jgi:uncharacterized protein with LGFP repeats